jgi:hypothetical protein
VSCPLASICRMGAFSALEKDKMSLKVGLTLHLMASDVSGGAAAGQPLTGGRSNASPTSCGAVFQCNSKNYGKRIGSIFELG